MELSNSYKKMMTWYVDARMREGHSLENSCLIAMYKFNFDGVSEVWQWLEAERKEEETDNLYERLISK